jgi:hypothetical protein
MNDDDKIKPFNKNRSEAKASSWHDRFKLTKLADVEPDDEPLWLIEGLIPAGPSLGVIFGQPKSGKSLLTADMFLHVAMARDYCGCTVLQGAVVYITKEGVRGFRHRMIAMRQHHNGGPQVPFYIAHEMPNFGTDSGDADELVALIQKLAPRSAHIAAIIIDTLARTMPGQSDSEPAVMSRFVENCDTVAKAFDCFVGAVHHSPRSTDTRSRGSNVLDATASWFTVAVGSPTASATSISPRRYWPSTPNAPRRPRSAKICSHTSSLMLGRPSLSRIVPRGH